MPEQTPKHLIALKEETARNQVKIALALVAVIPALSLFYIGMLVGSNASYLTFPTVVLVILSTVLVATPGFLILRKYPDNILKLKQYITDIARGTLPDKIQLVNTNSSDDIKYIEDSFNTVLEEMRHRIQSAEDQLKREHTLRETIQQQQQTLLEAERHRAMIQTLGAACHHIGQPATVLQMRMDLLRNLATNKEEKEDIEGCVEAVQQITEILHQLQRVSEFRTVPYAQSGEVLQDRILDVDSFSQAF
ncbi:MAG: hypothetical protein AB7E95_13070 [Kiritimatiellales bacterium]